MSYRDVSVTTDGEEPTTEEINSAADYAYNHLDSFIGDYELIEVTSVDDEEK
jgi:hypothetical protein